MNSSSTASFQGRCPAPFLDASLFPETGGFTSGRFCSETLGVICCLPCPQSDWLYSENINTITESSNWINVAAMLCSVFLLVSFAFLPVDKTHRHYLSVCLTVATIMMQLGFIIPLGANPDQCFNEITPNDMKSSVTCAFSGAFIMAGGWCGVMWLFLRSLALHLQICWQVVLGKMFMWGALVTGWGIPAIALTFALVFSGVSFRFGNTCHVNHKDSLADFWIPLLVFSGATVVMQFITFGYCIKVYLASLSDTSNTTNSSGVLPSYTNSVRTISPKQAYRRVRRVIELQWRGITLVLLIVADVIFFAIVFVFMDDLSTNILKDPMKAQEWLTCILRTGGDKEQCLPLANKLVVNEATVAAVLVLLSMNGIWALIFLGRLSMFTGWYEMIRGKVRPNNEFVSADAHHTYKDPGNYEMLSKDRDNRDSKGTETYTSVTPSEITAISPVAKSGRETPDYFGREARYKSPSRSFSSPKPPQSWDSTTTYAPPIDPLVINKT
ncbi:g- coupled receptor protein [Rutstroemia sp. NJR-2017a BBW]|nr:g- coupled receptor protein [Rutstroemia sp. NJR-2017a BBW]